MLFDERIKVIADFYGMEQINQLSEECCELSVSCHHFMRGDEKGTLKERKNDLLSEICDVEIMISQIKYILNISDTDIEQIVEQKLNRQLERIEENE